MLCVVIPFTLDVRLVDALAGVTREEGHTEFVPLHSAVFALMFLTRRIQPYLSLGDREVKFVYAQNDRSPLDGHGARKNTSSLETGNSNFKLQAK